MPQQQLSTLELPNHRACTACKLYMTRTNVVPGYGSLQSKIVFVGEAPGAEEDNEGKPFVGPAGRLLRNIVDSTPGMQPSDSYFYTNTHHCRPLGNRIEHGEAAGWAICPNIWLMAELRKLCPLLPGVGPVRRQVIIAAGKTACSYFRPNDADMPMRWHASKDTWHEQLAAWVVGMYHPAYALRSGSSGGETVREQNIAVVSMVASLQRALYYAQQQP